jgi:hypothetical protein
MKKDNKGKKKEFSFLIFLFSFSTTTTTMDFSPFLPFTPQPYIFFKKM